MYMQITSVDILEQGLLGGGGGKGCSANSHLWTIWRGKDIVDPKDWGLGERVEAVQVIHTCGPNRPWVWRGQRGVQIQFTHVDPLDQWIWLGGGESAGANHTCGPTWWDCCPHPEHPWGSANSPLKNTLQKWLPLLPTQDSTLKVRS